MVKPLFNIGKLDDTIFKALNQVYLRELIIRTPGKTGFTANQWSSYKNGDFNYTISNTNGDIVVFLENGTKAHTIRPKNKKFLRFEIKKPPILRNKKEQQQFKEKNIIFFFNKNKQPVLGYSKVGSKYFCFAKKVEHPGFEGQHFIASILTDDELFNKFEDKIWDSLSKM